MAGRQRRQHSNREGPLFWAGEHAVDCSTSAPKPLPPDTVSLGSRFCRGMFSCTLHARPLMVMLSGA